MLQENQKEHSDVVDFLTDACKVLKDVKDPNGIIHQELVLDTKRVWCKTQSVNSNYFGRNILELEQFENLAEECYFHMSAPRALVLSQQIRNGCMPYRYSIDAKSSESQRDANNAQMTLIDKLNKNKTEKVYTLKSDGKRTFMDGVLGKKIENDEN